MSALQKVFSRYEKISRMISNLEKLKDEGEITQEQYEEYKTNYQNLLDNAKENLKDIRNGIKEELNKVQANIAEMEKEANSISIRGKTGELTPEQVSAALTTIHSQREKLQQVLGRLEMMRSARSSTELGGAVEVDVNEYYEYRPEMKLDMQSILNSMKDKLIGLKGSDVSQTLATAAGQMKETATKIAKQPSGNRIPIFVGIAVLLLILLVAAWALLINRDGSPKLNERIIKNVIERSWEQGKKPRYTLVVKGEEVARECAQANLIIAIDENMRKFRVNDDMDHLVVQTKEQYRTPVITLCVGEPDDIEVTKFSPPSTKEGIAVSYIQFNYSWKPTDLLSSTKYQNLRELIRTQLVEVEKNIKLPVSSNIIMGLFTDGWAILNE